MLKNTYVCKSGNCSSPPRTDCMFDRYIYSCTYSFQIPCRTLGTPNPLNCTRSLNKATNVKR